MWTGWSWSEFGAYLLAIAAAAGASGLAAYWGTYVRKKGENLAVHEDIGKLVDQVQAVTKATEEIKTEISSGLWDRQKRWEIKREVLFELVRRVSKLYGVLKKLDVVLQAGIANSSANNPFQMKAKVEENDRWFKALSAIDDSMLFVDVTCDKSIGHALRDYRKLAVEIAGKIYNNDVAIFKAKNVVLLQLRSSLLDAIRAELGIDLTPQSSESSEARSPD